MSRLRRFPLALLALALTAPARATQPVQADIAIDGQFEDWTEVLTNPLNASRDGEGAVTDCRLSTDRDCTFPPAAACDLSQFAWTWNDAGFHFFVRRYREVTVNKTILVYIDTDFDGLMETREPVLVVSLEATGGSNVPGVAQYQPAAMSGDPLEGPLGTADGWDMPGTHSVDAPFGVQVEADPATARLEGSVSWGVLGGAPDLPAMNFHVSATTSAGAGNALDNMGGADGRMGTTGYRGLDLGGGVTTSSGVLRTMALRHRLVNTGNVASRLALEATSRLGLDVTWRKDADGDGTAETLLAVDAGGDGILSDPGDALELAGDTDGDGRLDAGLVAGRQHVDLVLEQTYAIEAAGLTEVVRIRASQLEAPSVEDEVEDTIRIGDLAILPGRRVLAARGDAAWLLHELHDNSPASMLVDLQASSDLGWGYTFFVTSDPIGRADATELTDTDGSGLPDVGVAAGAPRYVLVRADVPATESIGAKDTALITAFVADGPASRVEDETTVAPALDVAPRHVLSDGTARYGGVGGRIYFPHRITNARSVEDVFDLAASSDRGWTVTVLSDPDGDGRPYDAEPLPGSTGVVAANGGVFPLVLRVDIPTGAMLGESSRVTLAASSRTSPALAAAVEDDAVASIVRAYADAAHAVSLVVAPPCSVAHAEASGLPPSRTGFQFAWRDAAGVPLSIVDAATDPTGECSDQLALGPADTGEGLSVEIQEWDGAAFVTLDQARFDVRDELVVSRLQAAEPELHVVGRTLEATTTLTNDSFDRTLPDVELRWVVLDPSGRRYLRADGTFADWTGVEATRVEIATLLPREVATRTLHVADVRFEALGTHEVRLLRSSDCAELIVGGTTTFSVVDDEDGDRLSGPDELAAGTNPQDADSDDDGMLDGSDGVADSDLDGAIDALDCDADDDGLPDGLEVGVFLRPAATDPAAGCFRPDLWPSTRTDPDRADTDRGGVADGVEDTDRDGKVDPGELDPNDPADDATACSPVVPPEVRDVRVTREGSAARLRWAPVPDDPCTTYAVDVSDLLPYWNPLRRDVRAREALDGEEPATALRAYVVWAVSSVAGPGPTGL
jgi:hypothetical protein